MKGRANSLFLWVMGGLVGDGAVMWQRTIGRRRYNCAVGAAQPWGRKVRYSQDHAIVSNQTSALSGRQRVNSGSTVCCSASLDLRMMMAGSMIFRLPFFLLSWSWFVLASESIKMGDCVYLTYAMSFAAWRVLTAFTSCTVTGWVVVVTLQQHTNSTIAVPCRDLEMNAL